MRIASGWILSLFERRDGRKDIGGADILLSCSWGSVRRYLNSCVEEVLTGEATSLVLLCRVKRIEIERCRSEISSGDEDTKIPLAHQAQQSFEWYEGVFK